MTIAEQVEKNKDIDYWYCPSCKYQVSNWEYFSAKADFPDRCGNYWSDYFPRMIEAKD